MTQTIILLENDGNVILHDNLNEKDASQKLSEYINAGEVGVRMCATDKLWIYCL